MKERFTFSEQEQALLRQYGLSPQTLPGCIVREYSFAEEVLREGSPVTHLLIAMHGKARVGITAPNGKNLILCFYVSSGIIGEIALFSCECATATVTALDSFCCAAIPLAAHRESLLNNPIFMRKIAAELACQLKSNTASIVQNTLYSADVRLCRYILAAAEKDVFHEIMADTAYSIGVSYRHLYRMIGRLCQCGLLRKIHAGYQILNRAELEKRSQEH